MDRSLRLPSGPDNPSNPITLLILPLVSNPVIVDPVAETPLSIYSYPLPVAAYWDIGTNTLTP